MLCKDHKPQLYITKQWRHKFKSHIRLTCKWCGKQYMFSRRGIRRMLLERTPYRPRYRVS